MVRCAVMLHRTHVRFRVSDLPLSLISSPLTKCAERATLCTASKYYIESQKVNLKDNLYLSDALNIPATFQASPPAVFLGVTESLDAYK
jgi:hypothetical protein